MKKRLVSRIPTSTTVVPEVPVDVTRLQYRTRRKINVNEDFLPSSKGHSFPILELCDTNRKITRGLINYGFTDRHESRKELHPNRPKGNNRAFSFSTLCTLYVTLFVQGLRKAVLRFRNLFSIEYCFTEKNQIQKGHFHATATKDCLLPLIRA